MYFDMSNMDQIIAIDGEKWSIVYKASRGWLRTLKEKGIPLFFPSLVTVCSLKFIFKDWSWSGTTIGGMDEHWMLWK